MDCGNAKDDGASVLPALVSNKAGGGRIGQKARKVLLQLLGGSRTAHYLAYQAYVADAAVDWHALDASFAAELGDAMADAPCITERAKARFIGEAIQKQANLEAVVSLAYRILEEGRSKSTVVDADGDPNQDWLNSFTREAEYAFSAELRQRMATMLSTELELPGSFSRSTIRIAADIDNALLDDFCRLMALRFGDAIPIEASWNWGDMFNLGLALENALLVSGVRGLTHKQVHINDQGLGFLMAGKDALALRGPPHGLVRLPVWMITPIGQQICRLRPGPAGNDALRRIAMLLDKKDLETIHLGQVIDDGERVALGEQLWPL